MRRGPRHPGPGAHRARAPRSTRVGRREDAQLSTGGAVRTKRVQHRRDAAVADERHHHVDAVGGVDLRQDLVADAWLAGGVCQQRRIEQRDERRGITSSSPSGCRLPTERRTDPGSMGRCEGILDVASPWLMTSINFRASATPTATRSSSGMSAIARWTTRDTWRATQSAASAARRSVR